MKRKLSVLFLSFMISISPCFAIQEIKEGDVLNLEQCIEIALRNSPLVNKAKAQIRVSKASVGQAKSAWTPAVGVGTGLNGSNSKTGHNSRTDRYFGADATISQLIYDFGKTNSNISMQKFNLLASEFELDYTVLETIYNVKEAYYGVLAAKANRDVQIQNVEINKRQYDQIKSYLDEGIKSRIDFVNAEVNLSNAKISLLNAQDTYCDSMIKLNRVMYLVDNPDYSIAPIDKFNVNKSVIPVSMTHSHNVENLKDEFGEIKLNASLKENIIIQNQELSIFDKTFEEALEIANDNRPDLKTYIAIKDSMNESLKYTKRQWYPQITANAGYNYRRNDGTNTNSLSYGADLSIPTVRPVNVKYQIDAAYAKLDSAHEDLKLIKQNIYYDVETALCDTKIHETQIPLVLERVRLAKENFELADGRYMEGIGNYIELQDARSKYLSAQQEYINTVYQYGLARANLDFVMGVK